MKINSIEYTNSVLTVHCSGKFGIGSQGQRSACLLFKRVNSWIDDHPGDKVKIVDLDFGRVNYVWGDGPLSAMIPLVAQREVASIRFIASVNNSQVLHDLVEKSRLPWFSVIAVHSGPAVKSG